MRLYARELQVDVRAKAFNALALTDVQGKLLYYVLRCTCEQAGERARPGSYPLPMFIADQLGVQSTNACQSQHYAVR